MTLWSRLRSWMPGCGRLCSVLAWKAKWTPSSASISEAYAEDLIRSGVPRQEVMRRARLEFGAVERTKEERR